MGLEPERWIDAYKGYEDLALEKFTIVLELAPGMADFPLLPDIASASSKPLMASACLAELERP